MINRNIRRLSPLVPCAVFGLLGLLFGCNVVQPAQDDPTRYYVLSDPSPAGPSAAPATGGIRIGLKSVVLENYLRRREMVVRTGANEVQFKDYRRWAEALDTSIARVLRSRLAGSADVAQVFTEPFPADQVRDYDVAIEVRRCEGVMGASGRFSASLSANIEISTTGAAPRVVVRKAFVAPDAAWDGQDFDRLANLLTADISALGREVLSDIPPRD